MAVQHDMPTPCRAVLPNGKMAVLYTRIYKRDISTADHPTDQDHRGKESFANQRAVAGVIAALAETFLFPRQILLS